MIMGGKQIKKRGRSEGSRTSRKTVGGGVRRDKGNTFAQRGERVTVEGRFLGTTVHPDAVVQFIVGRRVGEAYVHDSVGRNWVTEVNQ